MEKVRFLGDGIDGIDDGVERGEKGWGERRFGRGIAKPEGGNRCGRIDFKKVGTEGVDFREADGERSGGGLAVDI